jgi:hypothetical protein
MFEMVDVNRETKEMILERGHKALVDALGASGAVEFIRLSVHADRPEAKREGVKDTLINIGIDDATKEVSVRFSRPTSWLRFSARDAMHFSKEVARRAVAILQEQS